MGQAIFCARALPLLRGLDHLQMLQTVVNDIPSLLLSLGNASLGRIMIAPGHFKLTEELSITRAVIIEVVVVGSVVLDGDGAGNHLGTKSAVAQTVPALSPAHPVIASGELGKFRVLVIQAPRHTP